MKNYKMKSIFGAVLLALFALVPVLAVFAEESRERGTLETASVREESGDSFEQDEEETNKLEERRVEDLKDSIEDERELSKDLIEKAREDLKDASSTEDDEDDEDDEDSKLSEEHKNRVSEFTKKLLELGKRDSKMKKEAEDIAKETLDSSTSTVESINKENSRSAWKTFLIGSDFKNLGKLRSELARTDKILERLNVLASSTVNNTVRTDLEAQIKLLQDAQAKVKTFVTEHESSFSLFGWFVKIFNE